MCRSIFGVRQDAISSRSPERFLKLEVSEDLEIPKLESDIHLQRQLESLLAIGAMVLPHQQRAPSLPRPHSQERERSALGFWDYSWAQGFLAGRGAPAVRAAEGAYARQRVSPLAAEQQRPPHPQQGHATPAAAPTTATSPTPPAL